MLIVIVVIWILAGALLPKIMWVTSRARDTKRVADLRNVAMAVQRYKMDTWEYPILWDDNAPFRYVGKFSKLKEYIGDYIKEIPKDPQKNNRIDIFSDSYGHRNIMKTQLGKWEYLYQLWTNNPYDSTKINRPDFAMLVAKVETPGVANYVIVDHDNTRCPWCARYYSVGSDNVLIPSNFSDIELKLCSSVKKVSIWQEQSVTETNSECKYSSEDQLYYVMKI